MGSAAGSLKAAASRIGVTVDEYEAHRGQGMKWCTQCSTWRLVADFAKDRSRGDGLKSTCRSHGTRTAPGPSKPERQRRARNGQRWCRGCTRWLPASEVTRQGACKSCTAAEARRRYEGPSGAAIRSRATARRRGLDPIPPWWRDEHIAAFGGGCAYGCGSAAEAIDHIWPVARGGRSVPGNLAPACTSCNSSKGHRNPALWVERGVAAFAYAWADLVALALEHNTDEWLEAMNDV